MQGKEWLIFLLNNAGQSYRKQNGVLVAKSDPMPLKYSYQGWQDILIGWDRDVQRIGVMRNVSLPLGFVMDGKEILQEIFHTKNFEEGIHLLIQKQHLYFDPTHYYFHYKYFYKGELDLSTGVDEENKFTININEGTLNKDLKANENTDFEMPVDEVIVKMDGVELKQSANYIVTNGALENNMGGHTLGLTVAGTEEVTNIGAITQTRKKHGNSPQDLWNNNNYFLITSPIPTTITIDFDFNVFLELANGISPVPTQYILQLQVLEDVNNRQTYILDSITGSSLLYNRWHKFEGSYTVTIPGNRRCVIYMTATQNRDFTFYRYDNSNGNFSIKYNYQHPASFVKANHLITVHKRLVGRMSGSETNAQSNFLENNKWLVVTSGDAVRGFENPKMKTSYKKLLQSVNSVLSIGDGIVNGKIVIEDKLFFLKPENAIPLGLVKDLKIYNAKDFIVNTVKIGFPNQTYGDVNGRNEPNTTHLYTSQIKKIVKELDLVSIWRGDPYGIEFTRINLHGKKTTDSSADNENFFLCIDYNNPQTLTVETDGLPVGTVYYKLFRDTYTSITGLISPETIFNLPITPKRNLNRHEDYLNSIFYGFDKLKFESADKNEELHTIKPGEDIQEKADFNISTNKLLFKPRLIEFKPETPNELVELLQDNPNRYFSFIHPNNGKTYHGFNMKIGIAPNSLEEQAFILLSSPTNDLTTLKNSL